MLISKSSFVITISQDNIFKTSLKKRYHITKETNDSSTTIKSKVNNHSGMNSSLSNILSHKFMNIKGKNVLQRYINQIVVYVHSEEIALISFQSSCININNKNKVFININRLITYVVPP